MFRLTIIHIGFVSLFSLFLNRAAGQEFNTLTMQLDSACHWSSNHKVADSLAPCDGPGDYNLQISYNHFGHGMLTVRNDSGNFTLPLHKENCGISHQYGSAINWILNNGTPVAIQLHYTCLVEDETGGGFKPAGEWVLIRGLMGFKELHKDYSEEEGIPPESEVRKLLYAD